MGLTLEPNTILEIKEECWVHDHFKIIGIAKIENGCCPGRPVLITGNWTGDHINYSTQCACGLWCSTGCTTAGAAVSEYEKMTSRSRGRRHDR